MLQRHSKGSGKRKHLLLENGYHKFNFKHRNELVNVWHFLTCKKFRGMTQNGLHSPPDTSQLFCVDSWQSWMTFSRDGCCELLHNLLQLCDGLRLLAPQLHLCVPSEKVFLCEMTLSWNFCLGKSMVFLVQWTGKPCCIHHQCPHDACPHPSSQISSFTKFPAQ